MSKTEIKYRTFDDLLNEVSIDFNTFSAEGMVEASQLIKTAQKCNYDLGLRIHKTKTAILDISHNKARLPDDFYVLGYSLLCTSYKTIQPKMQGRHSEDVSIGTGICNRCHKPDLDNPCSTPDACCICNKVYTNECGESFEVIYKQGFDIRSYTEFEKISFKTGKGCDNNCWNTHIHSQYNAEIKNGFIYTNVSHGSIFITYEGAMEDEDGNLLVLDHPMINEFYEYSLKHKILENLYYNGEDVVQKLQYTSEELRKARNYARTIVDTPDFSEMRQLWEMNRAAQHKKYYSMFVR